MTFDNAHAGWNTTVAFSPDGKWFATASYDQTVIIWVAVNLKKAAVLRGHRDKVVSLAFTPRGETLVSVAKQLELLDGATILWRVGSWQKLAQIPVSADEQNSLIFPPGSSRMVYHRDPSPSSANTWDVTTARPLDNQFDKGLPFILNTQTWRISERAEFHGRQFISVDYSPDGERLVTGEDGCEVQLWKARPFKPTAVIGRHSARIKSVAFSPDGRQLISGGHDHSVRLYTRHRTVWGYRLD